MIKRNMGIDREQIVVALTIAGAIAGILVFPAILGIMLYPEIHTIATSIIGITCAFGVIFIVFLAIIRLSSNDKEEDIE